MQIEKQLGVIRNKSDLHAWVDRCIDEDTKGVILTCSKVGDDIHYHYHEIGEITRESGVYMMESFKNYLINTPDSE